MTVWKFLESVLVSTSPCIEPVKPHVEPCVRAERPFLGADIKTSDNFLSNLQWVGEELGAMDDEDNEDETVEQIGWKEV